MKNNAGKSKNDACNVEIRRLTIDDFEVPFAGFQNDGDGNAVFAKSSNFAGFLLTGLKIRYSILEWLIRTVRDGEELLNLVTIL